MNRLIFSLKIKGMLNILPHCRFGLQKQCFFSSKGGVNSPKENTKTQDVLPVPLRNPC